MQSVSCYQEISAKSLLNQDIIHFHQSKLSNIVISDMKYLAYAGFKGIKWYALQTGCHKSVTQGISHILGDINMRHYRYKDLSEILIPVWSYTQSLKV